METETTVEETRISRAKNFVHRHKTGLAVVATSAFWIAIQRRHINELNEFLNEKDLYDEFWTPDADEE